MISVMRVRTGLRAGELAGITLGQADQGGGEPSLTASVSTDPKLLEAAGAAASLPDLALREIIRHDVVLRQLQQRLSGLVRHHRAQSGSAGVAGLCGGDHLSKAPLASPYVRGVLHLHI